MTDGASLDTRKPVPAPPTPPVPAEQPRPASSAFGMAPTGLGNAAMARAHPSGTGDPFTMAPTGLSNAAAARAATPDQPRAQPRAMTPSSSTHALQSSDPEVSGRSVADAALDLRARDQQYREVIPDLRLLSEQTEQDEQRWYDHLGLMGSFIDWFNPVEKTDPARWAAVFPLWNQATRQFDAALALIVSPDTINQLGRQSHAAMDAFRHASELDQQYRGEYLRYLHGYTRAAEGVHTVAVVGRDLAFAIAVGIAVVVAAPAVAGVLATYGGTTLGLSGAGLTAFTYGGTTLAMGGLGSLIEGGGRAVAALGAEGSAALADLISGSNQAADNFDWSVVGHETWEGIQQGFVDGVLAFIGVQAEKALVGPTGQVLKSLLGPGGSGLMAMVIRRALTRAITGGIVGGPIGALQAGYHAAKAGGNLDQIAAAMKRGYAIGTAGGIVLGGVGGAFEGRGAFRIHQEVANRLRALVSKGRAGPTLEQAMAGDVLFQDLMAQLRANPAAGNNRRLLELLPEVYKALHDPDMIAAAAVDIWLQERVLGLMAPREMGARYTEAAVNLSRRAGANVITLSPEQTFEPGTFFEQVASRPERFLDLSAVAKVDPGHGATTHMVQDLVVDRALAEFAVSGHQFRVLLGNAVGKEGQIGRWFWEDILYDASREDIVNPNVVWPVLTDVLKGIQ